MTSGIGKPSSALWVVTELYYPEETSTGHFMTGIAEGLVDRFRVHVLCAQPTYSERGRRAPEREVREGVDIRRVWSTTLSNLRAGGRLANLATVTISLFLHSLAKLRAGDLVLVVSTPLLLPIAIGSACFLRRARIVVLVHDSYPEVLVAAGVTTSSSLLARCLDLANRLLYRFAQRVVVLGRGMQQRVRAKLPAQEADKIQVIRTWADVDLIHPRPREANNLLQDLKLVDKFVVLYAGNISRLYDIDNVLAAMGVVGGGEDVHFLFAGRGGKRDHLLREIDRRGLQNASVLDWLPQSETHELHGACDVVLIPLIPGMGGVSVPSRLYNSLASGRPVIAATEESSELARIVSEEEVGWVVEPGNAQALAQAVAEAASDPSRLRVMGARAREAAEKRFSRSRIIGEWLSLLEELETPNSHPDSGRSGPAAES